MRAYRGKGQGMVLERSRGLPLSAGLLHRSQGDKFLWVLAAAFILESR